MKKWGSHYSDIGFFPTVGNSKRAHFVGGRGWKFEGVRGEDMPVILVDLGLDDSRLSHAIPSSHPARLPIASFVNSAGWWPRQEYTFSSMDKTVNWKLPIMASDIYQEDDRLPFPIDPVEIELVPMSLIDCPMTEHSYWEIADEFLGGAKFMRIIGSPYWLQTPVVESCLCGSEMDLMVTIGHEAFDSDGLFCPKPFFIGEAALYFFVCWSCCRVHVIAQST